MKTLEPLQRAFSTASPAAAATVTAALATAITAAAIAAAVILGTAAPVLAQTSRVGGGVWERSLTGVPGQGFVRSNYHHANNCHGATAVGTHTERANAPAGIWARAEAKRARANNQQYWRADC